MKDNKVSIIVPIYNGEEYLETCLNSLINQTYKNLEIICLNDGSTDKTKEILNSYKKKDERIIVIDKPNTGVSNTRNIGIKKSSGDYICFLDADDSYNLDFVSINLKTILEKKVDIVRCNYLILDSKRTTGNLEDVKNIIFNKKEIREKIIPKCLNGELPCFSGLLMIKRNKIKDLYREDLAMMEDFVFYINLLTNINSIYIIDNPLYNVYSNNQSATNYFKNSKRNILNIIEVNRYVKEILKDNNLLTKENIDILNISNLDSICDFLVRYYMYSKKECLNLCIDLVNSNLIDIILETNLEKIELKKRIILNLLKKNKLGILKIYLSLRKIVYKLKNN